MRGKDFKNENEYVKYLVENIKTTSSEFDMFTTPVGRVVGNFLTPDRPSYAYTDKKGIKKEKYSFGINIGFDKQAINEKLKIQIADMKNKIKKVVNDSGYLDWGEYKFKIKGNEKMNGYNPIFDGDTESSFDGDAGFIVLKSALNVSVREGSEAPSCSKFIMMCDREGNRIFNPEDIYRGSYVRLVVSPAVWSYDNQGRGVSVRLNLRNIQFIRDGEPLSFREMNFENRLAEFEGEIDDDEFNVTGKDEATYDQSINILED